MVRRLLATDVAVAVALCAFMVPLSAIVRTTQPAARGLSTVGVVLLALSGLVLALRRVRPYLAFTVSVAAAAAYLALRYPGWPVYLGAVVALISLVSQARDRRWIPFVAIGGGAVAVATGPPENWDIARMVTVVVVWCAVAGFAERLSRVRRRLATAESTRLVAEERLRIAAELHDVLSHSLATISLRAGVALHRLDRQPELARDALVAIRQASNDALGQARAALSAVHDPATSHGLHELDALASSVRAAGLTLELHREVGRDIPADTAAAGYRIVQEALTNVIRHAGPGVRADASVRCIEGWLEIEVRDDGVAAPAAVAGHGIRGMTERASGVGGVLTAGPDPERGFVVRARLPLRSRP